ncbi:PAAR domain-containing protein [Enterobacter ludwigii]|nr:PAAR domain-containing protein [Enterobacter ludwigii]
MEPAARVGDAICHGGAVVSGSGNVSINGIPASAAGLSAAACVFHGGTVVASGSGTVTINGCPAARIGDVTGCGSAIVSGSGNVLIGG